jgi:hypothetical protein
VSQQHGVETPAEALDHIGGLVVASQPAAGTGQDHLGSGATIDPESCVSLVIKPHLLGPARPWVVKDVDPPAFLVARAGIVLSRC